MDEEWSGNSGNSSNSSEKCISTDSLSSLSTARVVDNFILKDISAGLKETQESNSLTLPVIQSMQEVISTSCNAEAVEARTSKSIDDEGSDENEVTVEEATPKETTEVIHDGNAKGNLESKEDNITTSITATSYSMPVKESAFENGSEEVSSISPHSPKEQAKQIIPEGEGEEQGSTMEVNSVNDTSKNSNQDDSIKTKEKRNTKEEANNGQEERATGASDEQKGNTNSPSNFVDDANRKDEEEKHISFKQKAKKFKTRWNEYTDDDELSSIKKRSNAQYY